MFSITVLTNYRNGTAYIISVCLYTKVSETESPNILTLKKTTYLIKAILFMQY